MKKYKNRSRSRSRSRSAHKHRHNHKKRIYSDSSEDCENSLSSSEPKYKVEETKILCIENCNKL